jgi:ABC exporter DevB family membrane fusion protein
MARGQRVRTLVVRLGLLATIAATGLGAWTTWPRMVEEPTVAVASGMIVDTVAATGRVAPLTEVTLANGIPGRIQAVLVNEGDHVERGQEVIRFDDVEFAAEVRAAEARLETARAEEQKAARGVGAARARWTEAKSGPRIPEVDRARAELEEARRRAETTETERRRLGELLRSGYISRSQYDAAAMEAAVAVTRERAAMASLDLVLAGPKPETVAVASAAVEEAQSELRRAQARVRQAVAERDRARAAATTTRVTSTVSGKVTKRLVEPGEAVDISMPLLVIADATRVIVKAEVDETDIGKLRVGQRADVSADTYRGRVFPAVIYEIAPAVGKRRVRPEDPVKIQDMKVLEAKLEVLEGSADLTFGMTVDVKIHVARKEGVLVLPRALVDRGNRQTVVSVMGPAGPEPRQITLGASDHASVEVIGGLAHGERVRVSNRP